MEPGKPTNFGGRFEYLTATQKFWPELLRSLGEIALPPYERYRKVHPELSFVDRFRAFSDPNGAPGKGAEELCAAIRSWAASHKIEDEWLLNAAVQMVWAWAKGAPTDEWFYRDPDLNTPVFEPKVGGIWLPEVPGEDFTWKEFKWEDFKREIDQQYRTQLLEYRKEVEALWGINRRSLVPHAIWTVLWQRGLSPKAIRQRYYEEEKQDVSLSNIEKCVAEFPASIGLSLRKPNTRSSKSVQP